MAALQKTFQTPSSFDYHNVDINYCPQRSRPPPLSTRQPFSPELAVPKVNQSRLPPFDYKIPIYHRIV
ncbi:hypothetical protein J1614_005364 [Plenodomus biglobosus]|nr:hypothetical protein J1614_005364 [Plenodomus biglobosus]